MFVVTPGQMKKIDKRAIEEFRIPGIVLMENAALQTVQVILKHYPLKNKHSSDHTCTGVNTDTGIQKAVTRVLVAAGCGNNGGDGLAIARHLFLAGYQVDVLVVSEGGGRPRGDAEINLNALLNLHKLQSVSHPGNSGQNKSMPAHLMPNNSASLQVHWLEEERDIAGVQAMLKETDLVIDALFGTGLDRPVTGLYAAVIDMISNKGINKNSDTASSEVGFAVAEKVRNANLHNPPVVAVDIPSGINGETGRIMGTALRAAHTVAYGYLKPGHLLFPGREYSGHVHVVPISLPDDSAASAGANLFTLNDREAAQMLRPRPRNSHKGTFGRVAVIAGSTGMTGAAHLAALGALRAGAGLVTLGIPASLNPIMEQKLTEVMTFPLEDKGQGCLMPESFHDVTELLDNKDVLAFGPGCGKNPGVFEILRNILGRFHIPIVIDADGLNHISGDMNLVRTHKAPVILTPHPGEMSRLAGLDVKDILGRPVEVAAQTAREYGCIILLKGAASVAAEPEGRVYINTSGSSGMAKGGSGDVLTGIIASLIAQGYPPFEATVLGGYIHGRAGEKAACQLGETGMTAEDIINALPHTFKGLYEQVY
ncbi:MAG: NAD(P)H-hydrate dehydratase [Caldicoprobacterales bacterium]|jgi:hydroxyethylthiazole kinase-like uncharacterized protein yjeF